MFSQGDPCPCTDCSHPVPSACLQLSAERALGWCQGNLKAGLAFLLKKKKKKVYGPCRCVGREARSKQLSLQKALFPLGWKNVPLPSHSARKPALGLAALMNLIQELQGACPDQTTPPGSLEQLLAAPPAWSEGEGVAALRAASSFFHVNLGKPQDVTSPAESKWVLAALSEPKCERS